MSMDEIGRTFDWLNWPWVATVLGLLATIVAVVAFVRTKKPMDRIAHNVNLMGDAYSRRRRIDWRDVQDAAKSVTKSTLNRMGRIDVIIAPGARGAIFGQQISELLHNDPPIVVGVSHRLKVPYHDVFEQPLKADNRDWEVEIPRIVEAFREGTALIVDDYARGGSFMRELRIKLCSQEVGFSEKSVTCAVVVSTDQAVNEGRVDFSGSRYNDTDLHFPWGKAL